MKYAFNDEAVKRIAAVAFHTGKKSLTNHHGHISAIFHKVAHPDTQASLLGAHATDAMQHKFSDKDEENVFKTYLAKTAAINRGTLDPVPEPQPASKGKRTKQGATNV
jgi:hypothetical protein